MARPRKFGGAGADVPPAAVDATFASIQQAAVAGDAAPDAAVHIEPMEMHAPADPVLVEAVATARLRVMSNYAFYTDEGAFKAWAEGAVVTDPEEIELLTGRKAPVERIEE